MKIAVKGLIRDEKGKAMVMALILLVIGGLTSTPLLAYMGSGLLAGEVYEKSTAELYAADAGVEDAMWKIQHEVPEVMGLTSCYPDWSYNMSDVNGRSVDVTITLVSNVTFTYRVVSTATGDGSGTEIEAYVTAESKYGDYAGVMGQVLTSPGEFYCPNPPTPCTCEELAEIAEPGCGEENGPASNYSDPWPTTAELVEFYGDDVEGLEPYGSDTINLDGIDDEKGPLYREGELDIYNLGNNATLTLTGTVYVTGDTAIGDTKNDFAIDMNGQTIFVASNSTGNGKEALKIGDRVHLIGPGAIIAIGDIYFAPKSQGGGEENPIFIMSVEGTTTLQPGGDFYGSIAGGVQAELKPGNKVYYSNQGFGDLNYLIGIQVLIYSLSSWEVIQ